MPSVISFRITDLGMLIAMKSWPGFGIHVRVRGANNNGLTELEIREAITHELSTAGSQQVLKHSR